MYNSGENKLGSDLLDAWSKGNIREQHAAQYGRALLAMESNNYDQARKALQPLLSADPQNLLVSGSRHRYRSWAEKDQLTQLTA